MEKEKIKCSDCDKLFRDRFNMWRHFMRKHFHGPQARTKEHKNEKPKPTCTLCGKKFYKTGNLKRHSQFCKKSRTPSTEDHNFNSVCEFEEWKRTVEVNTKARFVKKSSYKLQNGSYRTKYCCHRSGYFKPQGKNIRRLKNLGTNKINGICPAKIIAIFSPSGKVEASFFSQHNGHSSELERVTLSKTERAEIAEKIANNIPFKEILSSMRNSNDPKTKRLQLITKKDLHNIAKEFKVSNNTDFFSQEDLDVGRLLNETSNIAVNSTGTVNIMEKSDSNLDFMPLESVPPDSLLPADTGTSELVQSTTVNVEHHVICSSDSHQNTTAATFVVEVPYNVNSLQNDFTSEKICGKDSSSIEKMKEEMRKEFELVLNSIENEQQASNAKKWIYSFHSFVHSAHFPLQVVIENSNH